jgi:hypothetical protein
MTGFGTATVDGTLSGGEWDAAQPRDFDVHLPLGGTTPGRLLVMNDGQNVCLALLMTKPGQCSQRTDGCDMARARQLR